MEDSANFARLKYEQERVLKSNTDARKVRTKLKEDYLKLQTRLHTLPDAISEDVMVPVGKVAFFPGHLIHTNEIMVLLGDNWFVERSAKQAIEIIDRRIKLVEKQLSDLQKEETNIRSQKNYTEEFLDVKEEVSGIKEIQEELPDDPPPTRKGTRRKAHIAKHDSVPRSVKFKDSGDDPSESSRLISDTIDHDELFARLNELEREEQEEEDRLHENNMKEILNGKYTPNSGKNKLVKATTLDDMDTTRRHVKFKNDLKSSASYSYDSDDSEPENSGNVIKFTHTPHPHRGRSASESDLRNTINTPADLFEYFASKSSQEVGEKPLKSILKKDSRSNSNENLKLRPILKTSPEHQPGTPEQLSFDDPRPILKTPPDSQGSDRRPGTPEYMLNDDPKSILKSINGNMYQTVGSCEVDVNEPRPILKFMDPQVDNINDVLCDTDGDETRSILKPVIEKNMYVEQDTVTPDDNIGRSRPENRRTILKFQENSCPSKVTNEISQRKTILKNTVNETISDRDFETSTNAIENQVVERPDCGFTDRVVERSDTTVVNPPAPKTFSDRKPVSRFKASRCGK